MSKIRPEALRKRTPRDTIDVTVPTNLKERAKAHFEKFEVT